MGVSTRRGAGLVASVLRVLGLLIVLVLVVYIGLTVLDANFANVWAATTRRWAEELDLGLSTLFLPADRKLAVALNYGLAAVIWYAITEVVYRLVRRLS